MSGPDVKSTGTVLAGLASGGDFRWVATDLTVIVEELRARQDLSPVASAALGRALSAATLLFRLSHKRPSKLLFEVVGDGPLGRMLCEVNEDGHVRGTVQRPRVDLTAAEGHKLPVGAAVGGGRLRVRRDFPTGSYDSEVELVSGEIGDDVAHFLEQSEQVRAAVAVGVLARRTGVEGAGGMIVEALPGGSDAALRILEENLAGLQSPSRLIESSGLDGLVERVLNPFPIRVVESRAVGFFCSCDTAGIERHLRGLSEGDLRSLTEADGKIHVDCVFCGAHYAFRGSAFERYLESRG